MRHGQISWPMNRWFGGLILLFTAYYAYNLVGGPVVETALPAAARQATVDDIRYTYVDQILTNITTNFWYGVILFFGAVMLYILIAGIPGQQEETWQNYR